MAMALLQVIGHGLKMVFEKVMVVGVVLPSFLFFLKEKVFIFEEDG
jgi:hypothetical protein